MIDPCAAHPHKPHEFAARNIAIYTCHECGSFVVDVGGKHELALSYPEAKLLQRQLDKTLPIGAS